MLYKYAIGNVLILSCFAFTAEVGFLKEGKSNSQSWVNNFIVGSTGSLYMVGDFYDNVTFGTHSVACYSPACCNVFYAKMDSTGEIQFLNKVSGFVQSGWMIMDHSGGIYLYGSFMGTITLGNTNLNSTNRDFWIAKFDNEFNLIWAMQGGSKIGYQFAISNLYSDKLHNLYASGRFLDTIVLGKDTLYNPYKKQNSQYTSSFIAKYDNNGTLLWARDISIEGTHYFSSICQDNESSIYVLGSYAKAYTKPYGTSDSIIAYSPSQISITKYDSLGNLITHKEFDFFKKYIANFMCYDSQTNALFIAGYFTDTLPNLRLIQHVFLSKLSINLDTVWTRETSGHSRQVLITDLDVQAGKLYLTGSSSDSLVFLTDTCYTNKDMALFVSKWDVNGNFEWVISDNYISSNFSKSFVHSISIASNVIYIGGGFTDTLSILGDTLFNPTSNSYSFLLKIIDNDSSVSIHKFNKMDLPYFSRIDNKFYVNALGRKCFSSIKPISAPGFYIKVIKTDSKISSKKKLLILNK
jgi:hypothetical protein